MATNKLTKQQKIARKAAKTRAARDELFQEYGPNTYIVAENGSGTDIGLYYTTEAAIKANINRPGRLNNLVRQCNFRNGYLAQL